jgi:hypothetical protein
MECGSGSVTYLMTDVRDARWEMAEAKRETCAVVHNEAWITSPESLCIRHHTSRHGYRMPDVDKVRPGLLRAASQPSLLLRPTNHVGIIDQLVKTLAKNVSE